METQVEELFVLRLPPKLAARVGARIDKHERSRGDPSALLRRRRRKDRDPKEEQRKTLALIHAIWGEDGILDYDSLTRAEDLLYLDSLVEDDQENNEDDGDGENDGKDGDRDTDAEEADDSSDYEVEYWQESGRNYIFKYGEDEYYATLVKLPCVVEVQKTVDSQNVYKTGDVGQILMVHDVKVGTAPRPEISESDMHEGVYAHGLTPPNRKVVPERFAKVSPAARRAEQGLTVEEVREADDLLFQFKELVLQKHKKIDAPVHAKSKRAVASSSSMSGSSIAAPGSTLFVYEEVINAEPWMESADDIIVVEQGNDKFMSSIKAARQRAMENKSVMDERRKNAARQAATAPSTATTTPTPGTELSPQPFFDPIAALKGGSIGVVPAFSTAPTMMPASSISLAAPPTFGNVPAMSLAAPPTLPPTTDQQSSVPKQEDSSTMDFTSSGGDILL